MAAPPVSRGAAPVLVEVDEDDEEDEEEDEEEDDELELELVMPAADPVLVAEDPVPVVVAEPPAKAPPRIDVAHTGRELARDLSCGQSLKTEETSSELLLNQLLRLEL